MSWKLASAPRAHPRSRGDHVFLINCSSDGMGSSPLARGPPPASETSVFPCGLIPARAGTTVLRSWQAEPLRAHPRSRGDHVPAVRFKLTGPGSSPLARGPPGQGFSLSSPCGLIPARAGTTLPHPKTYNSLWAHPRSRGDHLYCIGDALVYKGSSPLARGPPVRVRPGQAGPGLIPARAGTTAKMVSISSACWAHPRSRGDHGFSSVSRRVMTGSSPLARGPHGREGKRSELPGLIPARAGTTNIGGLTH